MAKIIRITPAINAPKTANPFKNLNSTTTNPFKYSNFEGNTLQFADVFEGFEPKKYNRLKMIATSVAGSMHKMKTSIAEPVVAFARKVKASITSAWDYAKNTNISDLAAVKTFNNIMNTPVEIPGTKTVEALRAKMAEKMSFLDVDIVDLGKEISAKWDAIVSRIQPKRITSDMTVAELEALWKAELAAVEVGGIA